MNAAFRTLACLIVGAGLAIADGPAKTQVVILDNENLIEGEVTRVDGGIQIRRTVGGDMTLPANRIRAVVADRKAAFAVVAERANRRDADERLRLARWCSAHGLAEEAIAEARAAARMRPGFAIAERYAETLELMAKRSAADPAVVPAKAAAPARDTVADVPAVDYNSDSFPFFASRVNAVLLNTCANCHAHDDAKTFKLTRLTGRGGATRNLLAALPHVNPADPLASPILVKAVTVHGGGTDAPIKTRAHPAYQTLETWVRFARAPEGTAVPQAPMPTRDPTEPRKLPELPDEKPAGEAFGQDSKSVPPRPTKTEAADPYDPAIFNGEVKPKK